MIATQTRILSQLTELVAGVRGAVDTHAGWPETAELVAGELRRHLPTPDLLTPEQRLGSPDGYSHTLHVEPDGSFSIVALVWRPGQVTRIHDHMSESRLSWQIWASTTGRRPTSIRQTSEYEARAQLPRPRP